MNFAWNDEQRELRDTARGFLTEHSAPEHVRAAMESELGFDPALWKQIGSELGWAAISIPEEYGGLGLTDVELAALLEVAGEALLCAPLFSSVCLGAGALLAAGSESQKSEHLPAIAAGESRATLAYTGMDGCWDVGAVDAVARRDGDSYVLSGRYGYVLDGHSADLLVVAARSEGSRSEEGLSLFVVPAAAAGVSRERLHTMDQTRRLAHVELADVRVHAGARLGDEGAAAAPLRACLDRALVALSAEQVGGAQRALDLSVAYANERVQFGRPIGSFQAIKHKCADMHVAVESARSASYYAACVAAEGSDELPVCAALAKATCSDTYFRCAADAIQIHGGVGFTWEYDVHLYFKRAKSTETFLGDGDYHRDRVAQRIGLS